MSMSPVGSPAGDVLGALTRYGIIEHRAVKPAEVIKVGHHLAIHPLMGIRIRAHLTERPSDALPLAMAWLVAEAHRKLDRAGARL